MRVQIECAPSYALAYCYLDLREELLVKQGAMAAMSEGIHMSAGLGPGGAFKALKRRTMGGDSLIMARYTATYDGAWVACAPHFPGDVTSISLDGTRGIAVENGALLACTATVNLDVRWAGLSNIAMKEGATLSHVSGEGQLLLSTYGGFQRFDLEEGQKIYVDTGHLVAFADTVQMRVGAAGGVATSMLTKEGLIAELVGPGRVWAQTRAEDQIRSWLNPERGDRRRGAES